MKLFTIGRGGNRRRMDGQGNAWPDGLPVWRATDKSIGLSTHVRAKSLRDARAELVRRGLHALKECEPAPAFTPPARAATRPPPIRQAFEQRALFPHQDLPLFRDRAESQPQIVYPQSPPRSLAQQPRRDRLSEPFRLLTLDQVEDLAVAEQYQPGVWTVDSRRFLELCGAALEGNREALRELTVMYGRQGRA